LADCQPFIIFNSRQNTEHPVRRWACTVFGVKAWEMDNAFTIGEAVKMSRKTGRVGMMKVDYLAFSQSLNPKMGYPKLPRNFG
jgi:hypothetical protein